MILTQLQLNKNSSGNILYSKAFKQLVMSKVTKKRGIPIPRYLKLVSIGISLLCIFLIVIHAIFPEFSIDNTTIALIVILIFPWLLPYVKTAKLPGGVELTMREIQLLEEVTARSAIGTIPVAMRPPTRRRAPSKHLMLFGTDPNLALASLRLDIERKIRVIAKKRQFDVRRLPLWQVLNVLRDREIIGSSEFESLKMIIKVCNKAVHAEKVDPDLALRVLNIGQLALTYLDSKAD